MSVSKNGNTVEKVFNLAKPLADELGLILWDIRFEKEGSSWYLRVLIDKDEGVSIEDCEAISRPLNTLLDETDPIEQSYIFEVGSPGLERDLRKPEHFEKYLDSEVKVKFYHAVNTPKEIVAKLMAYDKDKITLAISDGETLEAKLSECAYIKVNDDIF